MKRFFCITLCVFILLTSFSITAFADDDSDVSIWEAILTFYSDIYSTTVMDNDPNKIVDYWENYPAVILNRLAVADLFTTKANIIAVENLDEAVDGRYIVAELEREQLQALYDSFNDYWSNNSADIRNVSFDGLDITFTNDVSIRGSFGYLTGYGTAISRGYRPSATDYFKWHSPDGIYDGSYVIDSNTVYIYNGNGYYPPMLYVKNDNLVYQSGVALPRGLYYILNGTTLWHCGTQDLSPLTTTAKARECFTYYTLDSNNVINGIRYYRGTGQPGFIYVGGVKHDIGSGADDYSPADVLSLYSMSVGLHVTTDDTVDSLIITPPDDIPYDDDGKTVVMVPVDEPGTPVYLSPTTYNNYVTEGDIYNTDDHSNNVVSSDTVNNITNIYNNYYGSDSDTSGSGGSSYDDSKLIGKLSNWFDKIFSKLDTIISKIKGVVLAPDINFNIGTLLGIDDSFDRDKLDLDWKTLVQTKLPILAQASEIVRGFKEADSPLSIESDIPLVGTKDQIHFAIDFTWYDNNEYAGKTGREYVREGLSYILYVVAFVSIYRRTDKIFSDY